jgi:hypothetical protein
LAQQNGLRPTIFAEFVEGPNKKPNLAANAVNSRLFLTDYYYIAKKAINKNPKKKC